MALKKCPECGKEFSDTATACPHCGYVVKKSTTAYGKDLGKGIKEGLKGLNTVASPKKKATCIKLSLIPFIAIIVMTIGGTQNNDITCGGFLIGSILDLFKLIVTNNFKDSNNFPIIY